GRGARQYASKFPPEGADPPPQRRRPPERYGPRHADAQSPARHPPLISGDKSVTRAHDGAMYHASRYDRALMLGEKRNEILTLDEVRQYGQDSFGDPDYVCVYGLRPGEWYARGVRLLGRTAVECTRDPLASLIAREAAALADAAETRSRLAVDLFAGSANTLYWITRQARARRGIGFELDPAVFRLSAGNLARLGLDLELRPQDYAEGLAALGQPGEDLLIVFVAPPWGDALREGAGLDLGRTQPPGAEPVGPAPR